VAHPAPEPLLHPEVDPRLPFVSVPAPPPCLLGGNGEHIRWGDRVLCGMPFRDKVRSHGSQVVEPCENAAVGAERAPCTAVPVAYLGFPLMPFTANPQDLGARRYSYTIRSQGVPWGPLGSQGGVDDGKRSFRRRHSPMVPQVHATLMDSYRWS